MNFFLKSSSMTSIKCNLLIIGAGPTGLSMAQLCSKYDNDIIILESTDNIGGCHSVTRINGEFSEHGPRIYSNTYVTFKALLKDAGLNFDDLFTRYNFDISEIGNATVYKTLNMSELFQFFLAFIRLTFNDNYGLDVSLKEFTKNFSQESIDIIDRTCRLTDGAEISRYSLNKFLNLFNQQSLYKLYQPRNPNDISLFKLWREHLETNHVKIYTGATVTKVIDNQNIIIKNKSGITTVQANKIVFAIPPMHISRILSNSDSKYNGMFGDNFYKFAQDTRYLKYISLVFKWNKKITLPHVYGFSKSSWGLVFVVLSDYFDGTLGTLISLGITRTDTPNADGKTASDCTPNEIKREVLEQLKESFPDTHLPDYDNAILYDDQYESYISAVGTRPIPFKSPMYDNIFNVGTHNGFSKYAFTSMESAVANALEASKMIESRVHLDVERTTTVNDIIHVSGIVFVIVIVVILMIKK